MKINLALSGANGRMGKAIIQAIPKNLEFNLQLKLVRDQKINLVENFKNIDVLIDFSTPSSCIEYLKICKDLNLPVVIGTTGFTPDQQQTMHQLSKYIPILYSPNMSIGINICKYLLALLSRLWAEQYSNSTKITINETHHKNKKDIPSGTALMLSELINKNFLKQHDPIKFNSKRIGAVKGKHQVIFANHLEELAIVHKVKDRKIFAQGSLLAAKWLVENKYKLVPKLYNFSDIINLENLLGIEKLF